MGYAPFAVLAVVNVLDLIDGERFTPVQLSAYAAVLFITMVVLLFVCLLFCFGSNCGSRGPTDDRTLATSTDCHRDDVTKTTLANLCTHIVAGADVYSVRFHSLSYTRIDRCACVWTLRAGSDHGAARRAGHVAAQQNVESQGIRNCAGYNPRPVRTAGFSLEGSSGDRFHTTVSRRLVSQAGRIQLLHVRRFRFVPVTERVRYSSDCDHGVAAIPEDAKGGRGVAPRCERTVEALDLPRSKWQARMKSRLTITRPPTGS
jgi:hypothetical protein